ncbi:hypothetical protein HMPREF9718_04084 [Sphingobium yanoikuyae ATCC 51230]|uniref:BD-FAE-like domain-containing protein n=2 Tax=Sphingobium yanoikuyae TaxID=13690 RepID=K9D7T6_SPHYA|nr:hypothetical protein HMPREF9718_04084 [Sphingobium yanoikuyae ATCC 51230]
MRMLKALTLHLFLLSVNAAHALPSRSGTAATPVPAVQLGIETYRLWDGRASEASSDSEEEVPTLTLFKPHIGTAVGSAVIIAPGGAYVSLATKLEGRPVADWFASRGVTAFVLSYRVGAKAHLPTPLLDGARAVRYVRANAQRFGINPERIGMVGFSAGGHLAATTAVEANAGDLASADPVERNSSKPNFVVLAYPWLEGMAIGADGQSSYCKFVRTSCVPKDYARYRPIEQVGAGFPPTFIYHTTTDNLVPADGIIRFYQKLVAAKVPVEMHILVVSHGVV